MEEAQWYYFREGQQVGPVSGAQLRSLATQGTVRPDDLVWKPGMQDWVKASQVKGLFASPALSAAPAQAAAPGAAAAQVGVARHYAPPSLAYAGFWKRFAAAFIDGLIFMPVGFILGFVMGMGGADTASIQTVSNVVSLFGGWLYYALMESSSHQATLGKMALGIIVTDLDGQRISFGRATGRHFAKIISGCILLIGFIMAGFTEKKQALHDIMAGCLVVNKAG